MSEPIGELTQLAAKIMSLMRARKQDGSLSISDDDAFELAKQALKTAYSSGMVDGAVHTSTMMASAINGVIEKQR